MIKLRKGKTAHLLPTNGKELTLADYMSLQAWAKDSDHSSASLVACLSGIGYDDALNLAGRWEVHFDFIDIVNTLNSLPTIEPPKTISFQDYELKRKPFGSLNAGQRVALLAMADEPKLDRVLAICLAPQVYGKQWASNIDLFAEELKELLAIEAVPMAYFFLGSGVVTRSSGGMSLSLLMRIFCRRKMAGFKSMVFGHP